MLNSINSTIDLILMLPDFNETYLRQRAERALSLSNEARYRMNLPVPIHRQIVIVINIYNDN